MTKDNKGVFLFFALFFLLPVFGGCRNDGLISASGNVTLDGVPLQDGMITFLPSGAEGNSASASIADGKYNVRLTPGTMIVRIIAERPYTDEEIKVLRANPMYNNDPLFNPANLKKQIIPVVYNEQSVLKEEIKGTTKSLNFDLKSAEK
ncbi:MAG: hypothetical protein LBQ54_11130 [Planctomycetaceae bacterium]|jgi:hypothetical protein|nr:hypothetical protein [Planctomycetaceae bacterium]